MKTLIVDDEDPARYGIRKAINVKGQILEAATLSDALSLCRREQPDLILLDLNLGGEDGLEVLREVRQSPEPPLVVIITAHGSERVAVEAIKEGAYDYLAKPFEIDELRLIVRNADERIRLKKENDHLRSTLDAATGYGEMVGKSPLMRRVYSMIEKVADADVSVLITGESGSGKELVAREIHNRSPRSSAPLVPVNCAAIPENLIESELFGHEKGAFTGALQRRIGKFEKARGGTLFLDEIGDMPLDTQAKILRVLEEREIERLGGDVTIPVDVRVISATNRRLQAMVEEGKFREDLYYRLEVVQVELPPLRERRDDIPVLLEHFRTLFASKYRKENIDFSTETLSLLARYNYPGNVRQLRNLVERLVVLSSSEQIEEGSLPDEIRFFDPVSGVDTSGAELSPLLGLDFKSAREAFERKFLLAKLSEHNNNITHTAEAVGMHRQSLQQKIKDLDLKKVISS
ncbi:MAG: sigma-54-dependent Fis family transcriptional regulator [Acidobacteriota bacterium]|nr:MAG: sigma-54-dependent Fis family transcriptional regulator [Acidobacteriota bacterium]